MIKEKTKFFCTLGVSLLQINVDSTVATQANPQMFIQVLLYNFVENKAKTPQQAIQTIQKQTQRQATYNISYNKGKRHALFLRFILMKNSIRLGQIYCPSSGVSKLYTRQ